MQFFQRLRRLLYERAVFGGDTGVLAIAERELDGVEAVHVVPEGRLVSVYCMWDIT